MPTTLFKIETGELGFALTDPGVAVEAATIGDYTAFSCQITNGLLVATQQFDDEDVPGTFCSPGSTTRTPKGTDFALQATALQDPNDATIAGLAKFLYDNDSGESGSSVWFYLGLAAGAAPKAIGRVYIAPMDFGGEPRKVLTAQLRFPCEGRPSLEFGTTADA